MQHVRFRSFFRSLNELLKPKGQIFLTTVPDNFIKRSIYKQFEEEKWEKYAPKETIFAEYTDDPQEHVRELLRNVGFEIDVCEVEVGLYKTENFEGIVHLKSRD